MSQPWWLSDDCFIPQLVHPESKLHSYRPCCKVVRHDPARLAALKAVQVSCSRLAQMAWSWVHFKSTQSFQCCHTWTIYTHYSSRKHLLITFPPQISATIQYVQHTARLESSLWNSPSLTWFHWALQLNVSIECTQWSLIDINQQINGTRWGKLYLFRAQLPSEQSWVEGTPARRQLPTLLL